MCVRVNCHLLLCILSVCYCSRPLARHAAKPAPKQPAVRQPFKKPSNPSLGGGAREKERGKVIDSRKPSGGGGGGGGGARKSSSSSSVKDGGPKGGKGKDKVHLEVGASQLAVARMNIKGFSYTD